MPSTSDEHYCCAMKSSSSSSETMCVSVWFAYDKWKREKRERDRKQMLLLLFARAVLASFRPFAKRRTGQRIVRQKQNKAASLDQAVSKNGPFSGQAALACSLWCSTHTHWSEHILFCALLFHQSLCIHNYNEDGSFRNSNSNIICCSNISSSSSVECNVYLVEH